MKTFFGSRSAALPGLGKCLFSLPLLLLAISGTSATAQPTADWPQWRGPNRDGIGHSTNLARQWPEAGPRVVWSSDAAGVGYSSVAVSGGRVFTQGDIDGVEHVIALSADDGRVLWKVQPQPVAQLLLDAIDQQRKQMDANQDGVIDEVEALRKMGWKFTGFDQADKAADPRAVAAARVKRLLALLDADRDQRLTWEEAGAVLREQFSGLDAADRELLDQKAEVAALAAARTQAVLKAYDADQDETLSRQEAQNSPLQAGFNRADQREPGANRGDQILSKQEIADYFAKQEAAKDGVLTGEELAEHYATKLAGKDGILTVDELRGYLGGYRNGMGDGPRGTPAVEGDRVYVEGGNGDVSCLDAASGKTFWHINLASDFQGRRPGWGYSESPLIEGELLVVTPGGQGGTVLALNKHNGEVVWRSQSVTQSAHYASPIAATIGGRRQIVQFARESVFGLDAQTGAVTWQYAAANNGTANCATPIVDQDHVFASSAYGTGGGLAKIGVVDGQLKAEEVYFEKRMANHHGGIVKVGPHMYGFGNGGLICMDFLTGEINWRARSVGKGSLLAADGLLYLLGENHQVALAEINPEEYRELGRFKIDNLGRPSWAHPALAQGKLYLRNQQSLTVYDVSQ